MYRPLIAMTRQCGLKHICRASKAKGNIIIIVFFPPTFDLVSCEFLFVEIRSNAVRACSRLSHRRESLVAAATVGRYDLKTFFRPNTRVYRFVSEILPFGTYADYGLHALPGRREESEISPVFGSTGMVSSTMFITGY